MSRGSTWTNDDGLIVGFGAHSADNEVTGVHGTRGPVKVATMEITGTDTVDTISATSGISRNAVRLRRGSLITRAIIQATEAWTGAGTLDLGTWGVGLDTEVVDDADGIDVDIDISVALAAVGDTVYCDGALVGGAVSVGETSDSDVVVTASWETAVPTAGKAVLTVEYIEPAFDSTLAV